MKQATTPVHEIEQKNLIDGVIIRLPFSGNVQTWVENGKIAYHPEVKSIEEYSTLKGFEVKLITWDEYSVLHDKFYEEPFTEITEEKYFNMLECLPPLKWHDINSRFNIFFCSEAMSGKMNGAYVMDNDNKKYYAGTINRFLTDTQILEKLTTI